MLGTLFCMQKIDRWGLGPTETCYSGPECRCFACKNHWWGSGIHLQRLVILGPKVCCFAYTKPQVRAGTHIVFYSCAKHAVMCAQNYRWELGPIQTCKSGPNVAVLHANNNRWGLGPIETSNSVKLITLSCMHKTTGHGLGPIQTCKSGPKVAVLHPKTTDKGWDP